MSTETVRSGMDTWASSGYPALAHPGESALKVRSGIAMAYLWLRSPVPLGATVTSATLTLTARGASNGSRTVGVRRVAASWKASKLNWNNAPGVGPSEVTKAISTLADGDAVTFDVTAFVQAWADGLPNYGLRLTTTGANTHQFYAFNSANGATLTVTWADNPGQPTDLRPSEAATSKALPYVTFDYTDVSGNTELAAVRVQVSDTESFASPVYDSGEVLTLSSGLDLADLAAQRLPNPSFSSDTSGWVGNNATLARVTSPVSSGPGALSLTATAAGNMYARSATFPVAPGQTYTANAVARTAATGRSAFVRFRWFTAAGAEITTNTGAASTSTTTYAARTVTAVAPADAATVRVEASVNSAAAGEVHYFDDVSFVGGSAAWAGMADGQTVFWRVQVKDGAGLWSVWSDPVTMTRRVKPTVAISNLGAGVAYDSSPPIIWSVTGGTQVRYRVLVYHVTDLTRVVYDSKERQSAENAFTIPGGYLFDDWTYRVKVRVWDSQNREATPGDPTYAEAQADFHLDTDAAVAGPTGLVASQVGQTPGVVLEWQRSTTPDQFAILRDGKIIRTSDAEDLYVSGTTYRYTSLGARPNWSHRYEIRAIVNGRTSAANPSIFYAVPVEGLWITDRDRGIDVTLWDDDAGTWEMPDDASVYAPIGGTQVVRVVNGLRGLEGSLSGLLMAGFGKTFRAMEDDLYAIKERPSQTVQITVGDMSFEALIGNIVVAPSPRTRAGQVVKAVSFDFWEVNQKRFDATV